MPSRRAFCLSAGALALAGPWCRRGWGAQVKVATDFAVRELKPGVWLIEELGGNSLLVRSSDGPILVDTKLVMHGPALVDVVAKTAGAKPRLVVNTHHHGDHTGGNWAVRETARIVAHENIKRHIPATMDRYRRGMQRYLTRLRVSGADERIQAAAAEMATDINAMRSDAFQPTETFGGAGRELACGDRILHLRHFGPAHTDNDVVVHLPDLDVLHAGDLLFNELHPYVDAEAGADTRKWETALEQALELCTDETIVVGGHGAVGGRAALEEQLRYFREVRREVRAAMEAGLRRSDVASLRFESFKHYGFHQSLPRALGAIYDELERG